MSEREVVVLKYSSSANISFRGEIPTEFTPEEWQALSEKEKAEVVQDYLNGLVDIYPDVDE